MCAKMSKTPLTAKERFHKEKNQWSHKMLTFERKTLSDQLSVENDRPDILLCNMTKISDRGAL